MAVVGASLITGRARTVFLNEQHFLVNLVDIFSHSSCVVGMVVSGGRYGDTRRSILPSMVHGPLAGSGIVRERGAFPSDYRSGSQCDGYS